MLHWLVEKGDLHAMSCIANQVNCYHVVHQSRGDSVKRRIWLWVSNRKGTTRQLSNFPDKLTLSLEIHSHAVLAIDGKLHVYKRTNEIPKRKVNWKTKGKKTSRDKVSTRCKLRLESEDICERLNVNSEQLRPDPTMWLRDHRFQSRQLQFQ